MPQRRIILLALALLASLAAAPLRGEDSNVSDEEIRSLIARLGSARFVDRETATRQLIVVGRPAVPLLAGAAEGGGPETSWRCVLALMEIALSNDIVAVDEAETFLQRLKNGENRVAADRAAEAITELGPTREARAIAALRHMGAKVTTEDQSVLFDDTWKGGDAGLKHLTRLTALRQVNIEPTAPISEETLAKLKRELPKSFPDVRILKFSAAFIGIGTAPGEDGPGLTVLTVVPGGSAEKAGIKEYDTIYHIDGKPVDQFEDLVKSLQGKHAGDVIVVDYYCKEESGRKTIKVTLGARPGSEKLQDK